MRYRVLIVAVLVLLGLVSCAPGRATAASSSLVRVERHIDQEAGVACWVYIGVYQGGITCLPLEQTQLDVTAKQ